MHRRFLLALALLPAFLPAAKPAEAKSEADVGPMIYRPQCFGVDESEGQIRYGYGSGGGSGVGYGSSGTSSLGAAPAPRTATGNSSIAIQSAPPPPQASPSPNATRPSAPDHKRAGGKAESALKSAPPPKVADGTFHQEAPPVEPEAEAEPTSDRDDRFLEHRGDPGPRVEWGGSFYLSNDDSMSLASAQRLLWAAEHGASWSVEQVRPHELLNYFSFDTPEASPEEVFDVGVSAVRTADDAMSVAFAVQGARPPRGPLDLTLVVDRSGSMSDGNRIALAHRAMRTMAGRLHRGDRVDVVLFDDTVCNPIENFVVGRDDQSLLMETIDRIQPRGSTDLDLGLREGYRLSGGRASEGRNRRVMVMTDALLNTGSVDPNLVSEISRAYDDQGIRLTGVGIGDDFNDEMLNKLTEKGKGAYVFLGSEAVVDRMFGSGFDSLVQTVAHDVHFRVQLPKSLAMERFYGEEISTQKEDVQAIHFSAGTSQVFLQDLEVDASALKSSDAITLTASYENATTGRPEERTFHTTVGAMLESNPRNVHKARALMAWSDLLMAQAMGGGCGDTTTFGERAGQVNGDAEIAYVSGLVERHCGKVSYDRPRTPPSSSVSYKVRVDSDIPVGQVALACGGRTWTESLSGSDSVATFQATPGSCAVELGGVVPMVHAVTVPSVGGDVRCVVRGGRMSCS